MADTLFDPNEQAGWIIVVGWEGFQHYHDRNPVWIKAYLDVLDKDEYLDLTPATRALLHGLWLLTARRSGRRRESGEKSSRVPREVVESSLRAPAEIRASTVKLSRQLSMKVERRQLISLQQAGWIEISDSKPVAKPEQNATDPLARAREEGEGERELKSAHARRNGKNRKTLTPEEFVRASGFQLQTDDLEAELFARGVTKDDIHSLVDLAADLRRKAPA